MSEVLPAAPLRVCKVAHGRQLCRLDWRLEDMKGARVGRASRTPRDNERLVLRCCVCRQEG